MSLRKFPSTTVGGRWLHFVLFIVMTLGSANLFAQATGPAPDLSAGPQAQPVVPIVMAPIFFDPTVIDTTGLVSPAFGPAIHGFTTEYDAWGVHFSGGPPAPTTDTALFDDFPLAWGGVNPGGIVDLLSDVDGLIVMPGSGGELAHTSSLSIEAGFAATGTLLLEVFDCDGNLIGSTPNDDGIGPNGRQLMTLNIPGMASFRVSGVDTYGVDSILMETPDPCVLIEKEIVGGNDIDGDGVTDSVVEVGILTPSMFDFKLTYNGVEPVFIEDAIPAEWNAMIPDMAEPLFNGDFEIGDFTDWNQINIDSGGIVIDDGTFDPEGPGGPTPTFEGSFGSATWQFGPGLHTLWRDVDVPAYGMPTLVWADNIQNWAGDFSIPNQQWRVEIWNPADNDILAVLRETLPGDPLMQDWTVYTADLTPWAGQTIRIAFTEQDNLLWFNARLDAVDVVNDPNMLNCVLASANKKDNGKSATLAECYAEGPGMTWFWVEARCHDNKKNKKCKPTSCGALYLNDGAYVFALDEFGEPVEPPIGVSNALCLAAVEDVNGDGEIDFGGGGDEDGDGMTDLAEACLWGNDPCVPTPDEDEDAVPDSHDNCIYDYNPDQLDTDGDGIGDACDPCPNDPDPDCVCEVPFVCGGPINECIEGAGDGCFCVASIEGDNYCHASQICPAGECASSGECESGEACIIDTCCGVPVCVNVDICLDPLAPAQAFTPEGLTTSGN